MFVFRDEMSYFILITKDFEITVALTLFSTSSPEATVRRLEVSSYLFAQFL